MLNWVSKPDSKKERGKRKGEEERRKKKEEESVCAHVEPGPDR
jgi:hypothetical protein